MPAGRPTPLPKLAVLLLAVAAVYVAVVAAVATGQRSLLYRPGSGPATPEAAGLAGFRLEPLVAADGAAIPVWRRDPPPGRPIIVHFHGNGGGLYASAPRLARLAEAGFGVAALEYRGYPGAPGHPSETAIVADAVALVDRLAAEGVGGDRIVLYGWSLGSAVALSVAAERPVAALVLEAPPTSILDRAREIYFWLPVDWLLRDRWMSRDRIAGIHRPMLILHGGRDRVVPIGHGERLAALAGPYARFVALPEAGHADIDRHGGIERIVEFVEPFATLPRP